MDEKKFRKIMRMQKNSYNIHNLLVAIIFIPFLDILVEKYVAGIVDFSEGMLDRPVHIVAAINFLVDETRTSGPCNFPSKLCLSRSLPMFLFSLWFGMVARNARNHRENKRERKRRVLLSLRAR